MPPPWLKQRHEPVFDEDGDFEEDPGMPEKKQKDYSKAATRPKKFLSHVITITSETGVGSTTTLKELQKRLGPTLWRYVSIGSIMREMAAVHGKTIEEFAAYNRKHPEKGFDKRCDDASRILGSHNYTIIESRLAHAFVPHAFHVLLTCDMETRIIRRQKDTPKKTRGQILREITDRDQDDNARYLELYPGCLWEAQDFDFVCDTSANSAASVVSQILSHHINWSHMRMEASNYAWSI